MKRISLISSAIAAALAAGTVQAEAEVFGEVQLGVVDQTELDMDGSTLNFGFQMSEDMGNGMVGFLYVEMIHDNADKQTTGVTNDASYVGIKGDFGTVTLGTQSDAAGFACSGTDLFNYNGGAACGTGAANDNLSNAVTYANSFGAMTVVAGMTIDGSDDGAVPLPGDHTLVAVNFESDGFTFGGQITGPDSDTGADDLMVIGGTMTFDEIVVGLTIGDNGTDTASAIGVTLPLMGGELVAAVDTGDAINDETNIGFHKSLSKNMYTGVEFTTWDDINDDMIGAYLGMTF
jgi:hypothetical protein